MTSGDTFICKVYTKNQTKHKHQAAAMRLAAGSLIEMVCRYFVTQERSGVM